MQFNRTDLNLKNASTLEKHRLRFCRDERNRRLNGDCKGEFSHSTVGSGRSALARSFLELGSCEVVRTNNRFQERALTSISVCYEVLGCLCYAS